jgi:hypothetical protein
MFIEKKVWPEYYESILSGIKNFDMRIADFSCNPGDILVLREWNPKTNDYTGRVMEKTVTYVLRTKDVSFFSDEEIEKFGYQVISFR